MESRKIVLYMRLSIEDSKSGSMSLSTQRQILEEKLLTMEEYAECEVIYLEDNGHSGTSFNRPSLNIMIEMVKQREVACILVKDFSRLGRDMLQVGYLMESVFPLFYTRFISVSDIYDSDDHYESTGGLELTFRYLMAEAYSKDLSEKISASHQIKMQKGEYVTANPLYGYVLDENRKYVIDEKVADNVRLIFDLAVKGLSTGEIISELYQRKIETPAQCKKKINPNYFKYAYGDEVWTRTAIFKVLRDKRYIGTYEAGFTKNLIFPVKKKVIVDESERVSIPNHHPAIISVEIFEKVQSLFPIKNQKIKKTMRSYSLRSKLFCGICHHRIVVRATLPNRKFCCQAMSNLKEFSCSKTLIDEKSLNEEVLTALKKRICEVIQEVGNKENIQIPSFPNSNIQQGIEDMKKEKKSCYELMVTGTLSKVEYLNQKKEIDSQIEKLSFMLNTAEKEKQEIETNNTYQATIKEMSKEIHEAQELTEELVKKFIKKVIVYPDNSVKIEYLFEKLT